MLTGKQKQFLEEAIYGVLKESLFERNDNNSGGDNEKVGKRGKRESVMKWLESDQSNHAALAYKLYNAENGDDVEQGNARSLFTKKYQGEDSKGKKYNFDDDEITKLYNMKDDYINQMS